MRSPRTPIEATFESVSARLRAQHPGDEMGRMLQSSGLKTGGKFYAFATRDDLVVKLPARRVDELIAAGLGQPCSPGNRAPMKEWVRLVPDGEVSCAAYVLEARSFVAAQ